MQRRDLFQLEGISAALVALSAAALDLTRPRHNHDILTASEQHVFATRTRAALDVQVPARGRATVLKQFPYTHAPLRTAETPFPASSSANPLWSVCGLATRLATGLAKSLSDRDLRLVA